MEDTIVITPIGSNKYLCIPYETYTTIYITKIKINSNPDNAGIIKIWNGDDLIIDESFSEKEYVFDSQIVNSPGIQVQLEDGIAYCEILGYYDMDN